MTNTKELQRTGLALAILNLVAERPMHPYEMRNKMKERGHDAVIKIAGGSIYDTVERLQKGGFIEPMETSREGRRPERTVYALTESGRDELKLWLRELIAMPAKEYPQFAAALAFVAGLEKAEVIQLLQRRLVMLEAQITATEQVIRGSVEMGVPRLFLVETEYAQAMARAERAWVGELIAQIRDGDLWPTREQMEAAAAKFERQGGQP